MIFEDDPDESFWRETEEDDFLDPLDIDDYEDDDINYKFND